MLFADTAKLISQTFTINSIGDSIPTETSRTVFVEVQSIGLKRKVEAMNAGLKIERKFILSDIAEYQGEAILEYNNERYNIVNCYINDDQQVELTCGRY